MITFIINIYIIDIYYIFNEYKYSIIMTIINKMYRNKLKFILSFFKIKQLINKNIYYD